MKLPIKSIAAAVSLALISVAAHAQSNTIGTVAAPTNDLYLAIYDTSTDSELVNLGNNAYSAITAASGTMTPTAPTGSFVAATNPATGTGSVLQLNFGVIPGFTSTFTSLATTSFLVTAGVQGGAATEGFEATSATTPTIAYLGVQTVTSNITGELAAWQGDPSVASSGTAISTDGKAAWAVQSGLLNSGTLISGANYGGAVGSALDFYNITTTSAHKAVITPYANTTGDGFWFLSDAGDLSYDIPYTPSSSSGGSSSGGSSSGGNAVPLPAAVWLFGSGLLGLAGIGRRRAAA